MLSKKGELWMKNSRKGIDMKEETKQRFRKSLKPALFVVVWLVAFVFFAPTFEAWKEKAFTGLYFFLMAVAYGVPAFAAYRAIEPWLDYEPEARQPRKRRGKNQDEQ